MRLFSAVCKARDAKKKLRQIEQELIKKKALCWAAIQPKYTTYTWKNQGEMIIYDHRSVQAAALSQAADVDKRKSNTAEM